jgi:hypothetical protein
MDRCAVEFIARCWWRRVEIWVIALLLVIGGGFRDLAASAQPRSFDHHLVGFAVGMAM